MPVRMAIIKDHNKRCGQVRGEKGMLVPCWRECKLVHHYIWKFLKRLKMMIYHVVVAVQSLSHVWLFVTLWTADCQASVSFTISQTLLRLMSIESMMPSNHLILCHPLFLLPSIFPSIRVFSNKSALCIRWPKYWSFSFSISPSNEYSGLIPLGLIGLISLLSKGLSRVFSKTTVQKHQFVGTLLSL